MCELSAVWLQEPDINRIDPILVLGCEAPSVPGAFGVHECVCVMCVCVCVCVCVCACVCVCVCLLSACR